ncbi:MAG TPA: rod shape-determining protein MreC [bacterium]|nr:rod shape-determining protein MreC [bacterium]
MKMFNKVLNYERIRYILKISGLLLLLITLNTFNLSSSIRSSGLFFVEPMSLWGSQAAGIISSFTESLSEIGNLQQRVSELEEENAYLRAESSFSQIYFEKLGAMSDLVQVYSKEDSFLIAEVLDTDRYYRNEFLVLNLGERDGVDKGDVVIYGKYFVGFVVEVDTSRSVVRVPTSRESYLQVQVVDSNAYENDLDKLSMIDDSGVEYARGIVRGYHSGLIIENIPVNFDLKKGQVVILTDERAGKYLYLGRVSSVDDSLSKPTHSGKVDAGVNYSELKYLFILK